MKLKDKSKEQFKGEVGSGRFPPYIHYKVLYTSPQESRLQPYLMKVDLKGTNENLKLSFAIMQEACKFYTWLVCVCASMHSCGGRVGVNGVHKVAPTQPTQGKTTYRYTVIFLQYRIPV